MSFVRYGCLKNVFCRLWMIKRCLLYVMNDWMSFVCEYRKYVFMLKYDRGLIKINQIKKSRVLKENDDLFLFFKNFLKISNINLTKNKILCDEV